MEQKRVEDEEYSTMLSRWRFNRPNQQDVVALNSQVLSVVKTKPQPSTLFAFSENKDREALNEFAFETIAKHLEIPEAAYTAWEDYGMLSIVMTVDLKESAGDYTPNQKASVKAYIRNSPERKLGMMAGYLNIIIGGRGMINENFLTEKGISNGTEAIFAEVVLKENATIFPKKLPSCHIVVPAVMSGDVECITMKHTLPYFRDLQIDPTLPAGYFSVHPTTFGRKIKLKKTLIDCRIV